MPFWKINRRHPWSEREHEDVRTTLLNQQLVEYQEVASGGRPSRLYRLKAGPRVIVCCDGVAEEARKAFAG